MGIALGPVSRQERANWISPSDMDGGGVDGDAAAQPPDEHVRELLLHSALFERSAGGRYRVAHAALGDYLAARFIRQSGTPAERALRILSHPSGGLTPQHRETASLLAALDRSFFEALTRAGEARWAVQHVEKIAQEQCEHVLEGLFAEAKQGLILVWTFDYSALGKLDYPAAEKLVRSVLLSDDRHEDERRLATDLARELKLSGLVPDLLSVALDENAPPRLRGDAIYEIDRLGEIGDRKALLPLVSQPRAADPNRYVAYAARRVLIKDLLSLGRAASLAREDAAADALAFEDGSAHPPHTDSSRISGPTHSWPLRRVASSAAPHLTSTALKAELVRLARLESLDAYDAAVAQEVGKEAYGRLDRSPELALPLARLTTGTDPRSFSLDIERSSRRGSASLEDEDRRRPLVAALVTHLST